MARCLNKQQKLPKQIFVRFHINGQEAPGLPDQSRGAGKKITNIYKYKKYS